MSPRFKRRTDAPIKLPTAHNGKVHMHPRARHYYFKLPIFAYKRFSDEADLFLCYRSTPGGYQPFLAYMKYIHVHNQQAKDDILRCTLLTRRQLCAVWSFRVSGHIAL